MKVNITIPYRKEYKWMDKFVKKIRENTKNIEDNFEWNFIIKMSNKDVIIKIIEIEDFYNKKEYKTILSSDYDILLKEFVSIKDSFREVNIEINDKDTSKYIEHTYMDGKLKYTNKIIWDKYIKEILC